MSDGMTILCLLSPIIIPLIGFCMMIYFSYKNEEKQLDMEREQAVTESLANRVQILQYQAELAKGEKHE